MAGIMIELNLRDFIIPERVEELVRNELLDSLEMIDDEHLKHAFQTIIAYYSVPGSYEFGKFDVEN